jgi:hypothetical protein
MKFFMPNATDEQEAEQVYKAIKEHAEKAVDQKTSNRRIFRINYEHDKKNHTAEVGKPDTMTGEIVLAIFESYSYLICTPNRGGFNGHPIMAGTPYRIVDFDKD